MVLDEHGHTDRPQRPVKNRPSRQRIGGTAVLLDCYVGLYKHYNQFTGLFEMKLKNKKIDIIQVTHGKAPKGFPIETPAARVWAYFQQLSGKEAFAAQVVQMT